MKKRFAAMTLALLMLMAITASALEVQPRWATTTVCNPTLTFKDTTASCSVDTRALTGSSISLSMTLYKVVDGKDIAVTSWSGLTGTTRLNVTKTSTVTKGYTYKLVASVTVSSDKGTDNISVNTSAKCE